MRLPKVRALRAANLGVAALLLLGSASLTCPAVARPMQQQIPTPQMPTGVTPMGTIQPIAPPGMDPNDPLRIRIEAERARMATTERQKRMQADAAKLLQLSTELKAAVDKTTKDEMSVDVIRKAAEVEKLAHDIKERMKG